MRLQWFVNFHFNIFSLDTVIIIKIPNTSHVSIIIVICDLLIISCLCRLFVSKLKRLYSLNAKQPTKDKSRQQNITKHINIEISIIILSRTHCRNVFVYIYIVYMSFLMRQILFYANQPFRRIESEMKRNMK